MVRSYWPVTPSARPCVQCGTQFVAKRRDASYCSSACRVAAHRGRGEVPADRPEPAAEPAHPAPPATVRFTPDAVAAYRQVTEKHPIWGDGEITTKLDVTQQEVRGLKMLADAPAEFREKYFAGEISFAAVQAILEHNVAAFLTDDQKVTVLRKALAGLTGGASAARLRTVMNLLPQIHDGTLKAQWQDESLGMSYDDLLDAKLESRARMNKGMADEREWLLRHAGPTYSYSLHTPKLLEKLSATVDQIEKEMPALVALTFETDKLGGALREMGRRLYDMGEQVINRGIAPEARPAPDDTPVKVFEGLDDNDYIDGHAVIDADDQADD